MTELSFLIDLFMNHKLPKASKELIAARIKEVEQLMLQIKENDNQFRKSCQQMWPTVNEPTPTIRPVMHMTNEPIRADNQQVTQIAQTPAASAALAQREAIMSGKNPDVIETGKGTKGPRKW